MAEDTREERIKYLIRQYYAGAATVAESSELRSFLLQGDDRELIVAQLEELAVIAPEATHISDERLDTVFDAIVSSRTRQMPVRRYIYGAAAAVLALVVAGSIYFFTRERQQAPSQQTAVAEILPGHDGAVLTLANGKQVVLDDQADGVIGNTDENISKKGGELIVDEDARSHNNTALNTLTTPRGRQFALALPDGSKVWLNAASAIKFPAAFAAEERTVYLSGEGYFEIAKKTDAKGKRVPFRVVVNQKSTIEVLGTHFNINAYEDEESIRTTLLEGAVKVSASTNNVTLVPGQQAAVTADRITVDKHADLEEATSWKNGLFVFNGRTDLREVMRQLSRWYDVEIVYKGEVPDIAFTGELQRNLNLQQVTKGFAAMGVNFKIEGRKIIIYP